MQTTEYGQLKRIWTAGGECGELRRILTTEYGQLKIMW